MPTAPSDIVIASAARTPVGSFNGALSSLAAHELGAIAISAALERAGVKPDEVDEVILGQVLQAGEGQGPARQASMKAGVPASAPAWSLNQLCGSGLRAVALAYQQIAGGDAKIVVARLERRARIARATAVVSVVAMLGLVLGYFAHARLAQPALAIRDAHQVRFGDGSTVQLLDATTALDVGAASPSAVEVSLRAGSAEFEITPNPKRHFVVHAGLADISVLGTHFRVTREAPRVRVEVTRGRVAVTYAGGSRQLTAGESSWFPPAEPAPEESPSLATPAPALTSPPSAPVPSASIEGVTSRRRFLDHASRGEYPEAYSVLEHAPEVVGNAPEDLMLAADAARFSNHPAQATRFLERVTREHPQASVAPLAAFTLGRIYLSQLGQPAKAAEAFALSLRLAPAGSLAEDALAREVEAAELAGQQARAHDLAEQYVRRYPNGRRLASVRKSGGLGQAP